MRLFDETGREDCGPFTCRTLQIPELQSTLTELVHKKTNARILHIGNDDPENLFCLSFQTLPQTSNGVAHILEHTVLCGSEKFPVKDPFFAMTRRSLNTYMNALTGQDFTCYPASSQVERDFYNLLEVYLDAVFHPELKKMSFLQEGHRLEFTNPKDPNTPLRFSGVVYNEMKGAMSSIESRLWEALSKKLTPDLPYANNSGGDPKVIPELTHEELIAFHREFYHPSRCLFFFYGNLPLQQHIDFILPILEGATPMPALPAMALQKRFKEPVIATDRFPIAEGESSEKKTEIVFSWLTAPIDDQDAILALSLLEAILTDTDASPLTRALLKSNLCTQVDSFIDAEMSEVPWAIICKGCDPQNADKLQTVLFNTLKKLKISSEEVEAALHQLEFQRLEIGAEGVPFGLTLFMRAALLMQHGNKPEDALLVHTLFDAFREKLRRPNYLQEILHTYILDNPHFVRLTLIPDPGLEKEEKQEEEERLSRIQKNLSEKEKAAIVQQSEELRAYQESVEHQSLECLPKVTLQDVPKEPKNFPFVRKEDIFHHNCFTNQILYADLVYDLPDLSEEELPLLSLLSGLIGEVGCGERSYEETLMFQQAYIGGFEAALHLHVPFENPDTCRPALTLRGRALYRNAPHLFELFSDCSFKLHLHDKERVQEWLSQHATELQARFTRSSMSYAVQASLAGLSVPAFVYDQWHGLPYYRAVLHWEKNCDETFLAKLNQLADKVLGVKDPHLVLVCDEDKFKEIEQKILPKFRLPNKDFTPWQGHFSNIHPQSRAHVIAAPVAFTSYGVRTVAYQDKQAPFLLIASELMKNLTLHKEIREKGGAYGGGATYRPSTGAFYFYAYRDPNLATSLQAFHHAMEAVISQSFNERELEEAKLSVLQSIDAPVPPASRSTVIYAWEREGRSFSIRKQFRDAVISATATDLAEAVKNCLQSQSPVLVSFLGKDLYDKESSKLPSALPLEPV